MKLALLTPLIVALAINAAVLADDDDIDALAVIEARQSALRDIGKAFKGINDELRRPRPALPNVREFAGQIDALSRRQHTWFPEGTGQDAYVINAAKDEIWDNPADFKAAQNAMSNEASKLAAIAAGEDVGAIRKQAQALGRTCKACHDKYREET